MSCSRDQFPFCCTGDPGRVLCHVGPDDAAGVPPGRAWSGRECPVEADPRGETAAALAEGGGCLFLRRSFGGSCGGIFSAAQVSAAVLER